MAWPFQKRQRSERRLLPGVEGSRHVLSYCVNVRSKPGSTPNARHCLSPALGLRTSTVSMNACHVEPLDSDPVSKQSARATRALLQDDMSVHDVPPSKRSTVRSETETHVPLLTWDRKWVSPCLPAPNWLAHSRTRFWRRGQNNSVGCCHVQFNILMLP